MKASLFEQGCVQELFKRREASVPQLGPHMTVVERRDNNGQICFKKLPWEGAGDNSCEGLNDQSKEDLNGVASGSLSGGGGGKTVLDHVKKINNDSSSAALGGDTVTQL